MASDDSQKILEQLNNTNQKLLRSSVGFTQKKRTELMQACYKNNQSNTTKFIKCADETYTKTQKYLSDFQFKLLFAKFELVNCLTQKKEHSDKCKELANKTVLKAKEEFGANFK